MEEKKENTTPKKLTEEELKQIKKKQAENEAKKFKEKYFEYYDDIKISDRQDW